MYDKAPNVYSVTFLVQEADGLLMYDPKADRWMRESRETQEWVKVEHSAVLRSLLCVLERFRSGDGRSLLNFYEQMKGVCPYRKLKDGRLAEDPAGDANIDAILRAA